MNTIVVELFYGGMNMIYRSKLGFAWISACVGMAIGIVYTTISTLSAPIEIIGIILLLVLYACFIIMLDTTWRSKYVLEQECLRIRFGIFMNEEICYKDIIEYSETRNPLSSAALSIDRISIVYNRENYGSTEVLISPENKQQFINDLKWRLEQ